MSTPRTPRGSKHRTRSEEAQRQVRELIEIRSKIERAGIDARRLLRLLVVLRTPGGLKAIGRLVSRISRTREKRLASAVEKQRVFHADLHSLLDGFDDPPCDARRRLFCASQTRLVVVHFVFLRALLSKHAEARRIATRPGGRRLMTDVPTDKSGVIELLKDVAHLKPREVALLGADVPGRDKAIPIDLDHVYGAIRQASSAGKKRKPKT